MKKKILALLLTCNWAFAIDLGLLTIDTEIGGNFNYTTMKADVPNEGTLKNLDNLTYGAYGRIWLGFAGFMIAPQVKWDYLKTDMEVNSTRFETKLHDMQYGAVLGYRIPFINLTPYVGVSYSDFISGNIAGIELESTYAVNFGAMWKIPFLSMTIGFDGSYQKPKFKTNNWGAKDIEILTLGGTIGLIF